jgi:hypothetical protein
MKKMISFNPKVSSCLYVLDETSNKLTHKKRWGQSNASIDASTFIYLDVGQDMRAYEDLPAWMIDNLFNNPRTYVIIDNTYMNKTSSSSSNFIAY